MRRRQVLVIIFLFGVASIIILSLTSSTSLKFISLSNVLLPEKDPTKLPQFISPLSYGKFSMAISDVDGSSSTLNTDRQKFKEANKCPNILSGMVKGKWIRRPLTQQEQTTVDTYLYKERGFYRIPPSYQRGDGRCGDLAYEKSPLYPHMWFKAICNPKGDTPCCYTNKCMNVSEVDCRCPTCYDERQAVHAEYAQWKTEDDRCQVKNYTMQEACSILNGTNLHFVGDSFIRHVFAATVIVLTNNPEGALKENTPQQHRDQCKGMHQITWSICREYLDEKRSLCNGTVKVVYTQVFPAKDYSLTPPVLRALHQVNKSIIVLGLGIHNNFHVKSVADEFLFPFLNLHQGLNTKPIPKANLENEATTLKNVSATTSAVNIHNTTFGNTQQRTPLPLHENSPQNNNSLGSFGRQMNQLNSNVSSLNTTLNKQVFDVNSTLGVYGSQHNVQGNMLNTTAHNVSNTVVINNSHVKINSPEAEKLTNQPETVILDFRRSDNVKLENLGTTNLSRVRRDASNGAIASPIISESLPNTVVETPYWPRLLWMGTHAPGLLKSPKFQEQTAEGVLKFNKNVYDILHLFNVPHLDTFDFTNGVVSFDGTHYGWGINMLKVNMLLRYIADDPGWR